ncbi:MAG TPA: pre-peptidase C-terminal domain-containing protein, partial [Ferruginibacter sp.]|nr:pre-peptidase C-terminal domain-containing protein [Ferruginibacter sp.]
TTSTSVNLAGLTASTVYDWRVRATCAEGAGNYVQAQFSTANPPVTCPGIYDISTNGNRTGAATIPLNTDVKGLINPSGDNDYYRFVITNGGTITLTLTTLPANYHLRLLNSSGNTLQTSSNSGTNNETINRTVTAGTYYARVYPANNNAWNAGNCYTLRVQTGTASRGEAGNEILFANNWISIFPNPVSSVANLRFSSDVSRMAVVSIVNQEGVTVWSRNMQVNEGENLRQIDVRTLANGMYFIRIQNGADVQMAKIVIRK